MNTAERLLKILSTVANRDITLDQVHDKNMVEQLGLNSIDALEILIRVEGEFGIQIEDDDLSIDLVQSIVKLEDYIESKKNDLSAKI
jgi:acyl carrier protein